ncbi:MAG: response regulator, partial [Planctomycetes bacterium]|nr:response regulator [Planctomycetota bacterium]
NLLKMLKRLIGEDIILKTDLDNRLWTIQADKGNIEQVIMNLVLNARDAMPDGGQITFITENVAMDEEYCRVNLEARPGHFVCFSISDTGTGMNKETLNHLFEPFFTTKAVDKGTGLGLPVVHGIIKQHQGWVNVYSEPKKGSVFRIYLPGSSNQSLSSETEKKIIPQALRSQGERILLIEDEKGVLKFAQGVLTKYGYTVFPTTTVKEAKKIFEREKGDFQLVFSDTILPDGNGLVLIEQLLTVQPDLKVLLSSGYTNGKVKHSVIQQKKIPFIQKPYNINQLLLVVREILKSRR